MGMTTFSGPVNSPGGFIGPAFGGTIPFTGSYFYVNPVTGADGNSGRSPALAFQTLDAALDACTAGKNDVVFLIGNGAASGTARITETLAWNKDATHLIGIAAPTWIGSRARISHASTAPTTAFTPMVLVTGNGCMFSNLSIFEGFAQDSTAVVTWEDQGNRNYYNTVAFQGMGNATFSADETGSASLLLTGGGERVFVNCQIGIDTTARTVANASVRLRSAAARDTFINCVFPLYATQTTPLTIDANASTSLNRWVLFKDCEFLATMNVSPVATPAVLAIGNAAQNGTVLLSSPSINGYTDIAADGALIRVANAVTSNGDTGGSYVDTDAT